MTQENKDLLLKYLCAALPYGVQVIADIDKTFDGGIIGKVTAINLELELVYLEDILTPICSDEIKPYLRTLSSITEEEQFDYYKSSIELGCIPELPIEPRTLATDWLLKNHFDFRGLIERGLAIEVTEENNPYEIKL